MDLTLKKLTIVLFFACGLLTLAGCKKDNEATKEPEGEPTLEAAWTVTSWKIDGKEYFNVWQEFPNNVTCPQQGGKTISCYNKSRLSAKKLVLQRDETFFWTYTDDNMMLDENKSRDNCNCIYKPIFQTGDSKEEVIGYWDISPNGKKLILTHISSGGRQDYYSIMSLTTKNLQLRYFTNGVTHDYMFVK